MKRDYIRGMSDATCVSLGTRYFFAEDHYNPEAFDTVKEHLMEFARFREIDIMVAGFHGRKGPKQDNTVLGSGVTHLSCHAVCPILIIKDPIDRSTKPNGAYSHACCIDNSVQSLGALNMILKVMWP